MSKKNKKVFKKLSTLAPKVTINNRWVNWRQNEMKDRQLHLANLVQKLVLKSLWVDQTNIDNQVSNLLSLRLQNRLWNVGKRSSDSRLKNYCHYIGRARSFSRKLFMSRHSLRRFVRFGMIPGFIHERE